MGKRSKERKQSEPSSSSEEQEKSTTKSSKSEKKKINEDQKSAEDTTPSSTVKDGSKSKRQIKVPVYKLDEAKRKPLKKKEQASETESVSVKPHKKKVEHLTLGKDGSTKRKRLAEDACSSHTSTSSSKTKTSTEGLKENSRKERHEKKSGVESHKKTPKSSVVSEEPERKKHKKAKKHKHEKKSKTHDENEKKSSHTTHSLSSKSRLKASQELSSVSSDIKSKRDKSADSSLIKNIPFFDSSKPPPFKIPKISRTENKKIEDNDVVCSSLTPKHDKNLSDPETAVRNSTQDIFEEVPSSSDIIHQHAFEEHFKLPCVSSEFQAEEDTSKKTCYDQIPALPDRPLSSPEDSEQVNVAENQMDIDLPEEAVPHLSNRQATHQKLTIVLDTNILISYLDYVKKLLSQGLEGQGFPLILIPWVVQKELDALKHRKSDGSVSSQAVFAISFLYQSLKENPHLTGQSKEACEKTNHQKDDSNDDRVLECCLQYQNVHPECAVILCTDDKNLCCKAMVSGVNVLRMSEFQAEFKLARNGVKIPQSFPGPLQTNSQVPVPIQREICEPVQSQVEENFNLEFEVVEKAKQPVSEVEKEQTGSDLRRYVSELEACLHEVLSVILEEGMKAAFDELWLEIVYIKPPWTLQDILQCFKKHWIAVFGNEVPRSLQKTLLNLIQFFYSGEKVDHIATSEALQQAKEFVEAFWKTSAPVSNAVSKIDHIHNKLHNQLQPSVEDFDSTGDFIMNDEDEDGNNGEKQATRAQVSPQDVWLMFESLWHNLVPTSRNVVADLGFDFDTKQRVRLVGNGPQLQEALACLDKLSSAVSQLLQAFSSILTSTADINQASTVLSIIHQVVGAESKVTARDVLDCFSIEEYRTRLQCGAANLTLLYETLKGCGQIANATSDLSDPTMV